jgi:hypothetical protein
MKGDRDRRCGTIAAFTVIYVLSMGSAFRCVRRASFPYYQPVRWVVHETQCSPIMDAYCAYLNWWADL